MIHQRLLQLKDNKDINSNTKSLKALTTVKELLFDIDFNSEKIPHENLQKFINLLTFLKGDNLSPEELNIAKLLTIA